MVKWIATHLQPINTGVPGVPGCLSPDATSSSMTLRRRHWHRWAETLVSFLLANLGFLTQLSEQFWLHQPWHSQVVFAFQPLRASKNWRAHLARTPRFETKNHQFPMMTMVTYGDIWWPNGDTMVTQWWLCFIFLSPGFWAPGKANWLFRPPASTPKSWLLNRWAVGQIQSFKFESTRRI